MMRIEEIPEAVRRLQEIGGVLEFVFFRDADAGIDASRKAVGQAVEYLGGSCDPAVLQRLPCRPLARDAFLGRWTDPSTGVLLQRGTWTLSDSRRVENPSFRELEAWRREGVEIRGGSHPVGCWSQEGFGYALSRPPYTLLATPGTVQEVFEDICGLVLPQGADCTILDWAGPEAVALCPSYFEAGAEWWGVFLYTVEVPQHGTVTVIAGSATD